MKSSARPTALRYFKGAVIASIILVILFLSIASILKLLNASPLDDYLLQDANCIRLTRGDVYREINDSDTIRTITAELRDLSLTECEMPDILTRGLYSIAYYDNDNHLFKIILYPDHLIIVEADQRIFDDDIQWYTVSDEEIAPLLDLLHTLYKGDEVMPEVERSVEKSEWFTEEEINAAMDAAIEWWIENEFPPAFMNTLVYSDSMLTDWYQYEFGISKSDFSTHIQNEHNGKPNVLYFNAHYTSYDQKIGGEIDTSLYAVPLKVQKQGDKWIAGTDIGRHEQPIPENECPTLEDFLSLAITSVEFTDSVGNCYYECIEEKELHTILHTLSSMHFNELPEEPDGFSKKLFLQLHAQRANSIRMTLEPSGFASIYTTTDITNRQYRWYSFPADEYEAIRACMEKLSTLSPIEELMKDSIDSLEIQLPEHSSSHYYFYNEDVIKVIAQELKWLDVAPAEAPAEISFHGPTLALSSSNTAPVLRFDSTGWIQITENGIHQTLKASQEEIQSIMELLRSTVTANYCTDTAQLWTEIFSAAELDTYLHQPASAYQFLSNQQRSLVLAGLSRLQPAESSGVSDFTPNYSTVGISLPQSHFAIFAFDNAGGMQLTVTDAHHTPLLITLYQLSEEDRANMQSCITAVNSGQFESEVIQNLTQHFQNTPFSTRIKSNNTVIALLGSKKTELIDLFQSLELNEASTLPQVCLSEMTIEFRTQEVTVELTPIIPGEMRMRVYFNGDYCGTEWYELSSVTATQLISRIESIIIN